MYRLRFHGYFANYSHKVLIIYMANNSTNELITVCYLVRTPAICNINTNQDYLLGKIKTARCDYIVYAAA